MDLSTYLVRQVVCHASESFHDRFTVVAEPKTSYRRGPFGRPLLTAAEILASLQDRGLSPTEARRL